MCDVFLLCLQFSPSIHRQEEKGRVSEQIMVWSVWSVSGGTLTWGTPFQNHETNEIKNPPSFSMLFCGERERCGAAEDFCHYENECVFPVE